MNKKTQREDLRQAMKWLILLSLLAIVIIGYYALSRKPQSNADINYINKDVGDRDSTTTEENTQHTE